MKPLRIICYNIHGGYDNKGRRSLSRLNTLMNDLDIDIGIFQEMETRPKRGGTAEDVDILAGAERPHHLPGPTLKEGKGWYGNLLVSRHPITRALVHDLETKSVWEPRNALDALIETPQGKLRLIGTHLSLSSSMRWWEINNLIKLADAVEDEAQYPVLFMGDFNEWFWSGRLIKHLDQIMVPLSCSKTFPSRYPLFKLDRVWCDGAIEKAEARTLTGREVRGISDHLPVLIELQLTQKPT